MSTSTAVIGLGGLLRSGKDTVADYLVEKYGYVKMGMSDALLDVALILDPWVPIDTGTAFDAMMHPVTRFSDLVEAVGYVEAKQNLEVRRFLQQLGTEVGREMIDQNLWVDLMSEKIARALQSEQKVVVTGIRFTNELDLIQGRWQGTTAWVTRPGLNSSSTHASETSVQEDDFLVTLMNDGSLQELYDTVDHWMRLRGV